MYEQPPGRLSQRVIERARENTAATGSVGQSGIGQQIAQRPWLSVGLALAAGYMLGGRSAPARQQSPQSFRSYTPGEAGASARHSPPSATASLREYSAEPAEPQPPARAHTSAEGITHYPGGTPASATARQPRAEHSAGLGQLGDQISGEIDALKGAAVSAVIDLLRSTVAQSLPGVSREMERLRHERTASPSDAPIGAVGGAP